MPRRDASLDLPFDAPRPPPDALAPAAPPTPMSVAELDRRLKRLVEESTAEVHVEGEVSNLKDAASGHLYFCLKDEREDAMIECVMYRMAPPRSKRVIANGARVVLVGRATVYAQRGRLQFQADSARPAGRGALLEALERLKEKLAAEGLFAPERKRKLPADARVIGVVTSSDGAAIHDIVKVAARRGSVRIVLARAPVQGDRAAIRIVRALGSLARVREVQAIILGRGGGSAEDLAAFNDEAVARAIAACPVPVVSAVGHETDVTISDLVADARAATPSQAAEMLVPDAVARSAVLKQLDARLRRALAHRFATMRAEVERRRGALARVERLVGAHQQEVDDAVERMRGCVTTLLARRRAALHAAERRLAARHPTAVLAQARGELAPLEVRLGAAARRRLALARRELAREAARLDAMSPLAVLSRGYAIATDELGHAVRDARETREGAALDVRLHQGRLRVEVKGITGGGDPEGSAR